MWCGVWWGGEAGTREFPLGAAAAGFTHGRSSHWRWRLSRPTAAMLRCCDAAMLRCCECCECCDAASTAELLLLRVVVAVAAPFGGNWPLTLAPPACRARRRCIACWRRARAGARDCAQGARRKVRGGGGEAAKHRNRRSGLRVGAWAGAAGTWGGRMWRAGWASCGVAIAVRTERHRHAHGDARSAL